MSNKLFNSKLAHHNCFRQVIKIPPGMTMFFQVLLDLVKYDLLSTTQVKSVLARTA